MERLSKVMAQAGVSSRRKADELILEGKVKVNGEVIKTLGYKVSTKDIILVNDQLIKKEILSYFLLNKPSGFLSTNLDEHKRRSYVDLLKGNDKSLRLFPIQKLEYDMAGALVLTNDGDLTKILTRTEVDLEKEYTIRVDGVMKRESIRRLKAGIKLNNLMFKPKFLQVIEFDKTNQSTLLKIIVVKETNKQIREVLASLEHKVKNITRTRFDFLTLEGVERGNYRELKAHEIKRLYRER